MSQGINVNKHYILRARSCVASIATELSKLFFVCVTYV